MRFPEAKVADLLLLQQRDDTFINELQDHIQTIFKLFGARNYHTLKRIVPDLTKIWYYFMTTLGNLQTLGEEYTGTIRINNDNIIPTKFHELIWLLLYIGGEPLFDRLINSWKRNVKASETMRDEAKNVFLKFLNFIQENKQTFKRLHHSLFYIDGRYYNISNRLTGIRYALVRPWLQDDTFTQSFRILGYLSFAFLLTNFTYNVWSTRMNNLEQSDDSLESNNYELSGKGCILCAENLKNPCATPCGHIFCWDCIYDSLNYQQNCPVCREVVVPSRVVFLQNY